MQVLVKCFLQYSLPFGVVSGQAGFALTFPRALAPVFSPFRSLVLALVAFVEWCRGWWYPVLVLGLAFPFGAVCALAVVVEG